MSVDQDSPIFTIVAYTKGGRTYKITDQSAKNFLEMRNDIDDISNTTIFFGSNIVLARSSIEALVVTETVTEKVEEDATGE